MTQAMKETVQRNRNGMRLKSPWLELAVMSFTLVASYVALLFITRG